MSREEIDRILNSDLTDIDHTVNSKINSIDSITGKLSEKSNFLAQFQMLLKQELKGLVPEVEKQEEQEEVAEERVEMEK